MSLLKWIAKAREVGNIKSPVDWLRVLADGNLFITLFEKGPAGTLVGEDQFGSECGSLLLLQKAARGAADRVRALLRVGFAADAAVAAGGWSRPNARHC